MMHKDLSDKSIAATILEMAQQRGHEKSLCPSEVARYLSPDDWRPLMALVRAVAFELASQSLVRITQKGVVVDPGTVKGPIRISLQ